VTMVINIVANILLIPRFDVVGACVAALLSFSFMIIAGWYFTRRALPIRFAEVFQRIGGIFIASILMTLVVIVVKQYVHFSLAIPLGAAVYISLLFVFKCITREHLTILKRVLRKPSYAPQDPPSNA